MADLTSVADSKDGDNAQTLLDQLGIDKDSEQGKAIQESVGTSDYIGLSDLGGEVGSSFGLFERALAAQSNWDRTRGRRDPLGPRFADYNNCAETCTRLAFPGVGIDRSRIDTDPAYADSFYKDQKNITKSETKFLDAVRWADRSNTATHFANVVFKEDNGNVQVFSRSGIRGRLEIRDATSLEGGNYGTIRGIGRDSTGYYSRTEKRK